MMQKLHIDLGDMLEALPLAWNDDTRRVYAPHHSDSPAAGQCVVSSLLIQKHFGGKLIRCRVQPPGESLVHYFNEVNGMMIDSTRSQFGPIYPTYSNFWPDPPVDLYIFPGTWESVRLLESRVLDIMNSTYVYGWK